MAIVKIIIVGTHSSLFCCFFFLGIWLIYKQDVKIKIKTAILEERNLIMSSADRLIRDKKKESKTQKETKTYIERESDIDIK